MASPDAARYTAPSEAIVSKATENVNGGRWGPPSLLATLSGAYVPTETAVCSVERSSLTPGPMVEETAARRR